MRLRELKKGDRFIHFYNTNKRTAERFVVCGEPEFNIRAGTATRKCISESGNGMVDKQCILKVIKLPDR